MPILHRGKLIIVNTILVLDNLSEIKFFRLGGATDKIAHLPFVEQNRTGDFVYCKIDLEPVNSR